MVKSRRGIPFGNLRNKKGHPIYSREDIREQYCITRKELEVLEHSLHNSSAARLFGCLSTSHLPDSNCNKNSFLLLSCVQRRKNSSELDEDSDSGPKLLENSKLESIRRVVDDEDSSDGGFKQRMTASNPITRTVKKIESIDSTGSYESTQRSRLETIGNSFDSSYEFTNQLQLDSPLKRPTNLYFIENRESPQMRHPGSHSVDELNDRQLSDGMSWKSSRMAKTPDMMDDKRQLMKKRVTFATTTPLVRSATVGGINDIHSPQQMSQAIGERLVTEKIQVNGSVVMRNTDSIDSELNQKSIADFLPLYKAAMRRAVMKTQATQTDTASKRVANRASRRSIPAYLTLSPRTSKPDSEIRIYGNNFDSEEEEVIQISMKDKKLRKFNKLKTLDKSKPKRKIRTNQKTKNCLPNIDNKSETNEIEFQKLDSSSHSESSRIENIPNEELNTKSSTDSNQLKSESELMSSVTNDLDSLQSQDSTTIISELNDSSVTNEDNQQLIDEINEDFVDATDVTKRPLIIDPKKAIIKASESSITSPESDNYSFPAEHKILITETSPQDSSSPPVDNNSGGSSVYVSACDASKDKTSGQTSYETASSGSIFSSPLSDHSTNSNKDPDYNSEYLETSENTKTVKSEPKTQINLMANNPQESTSESLEDLDLRDRTFSPESIASTHNSTEYNVDDFDSEDVGDVTPVQDLSTDTSTAVETSTVIEIIVKTKPKIPPKPTFLLGDQKINLQQMILESTVDNKPLNESSTVEECDQSDDNEEVIDDMSGGEFICRRNMSGELSTVSEVSEEISLNGKSHKSDSGSGHQMYKNGKKSSNNENVMTSSDTGGIRSNTPSISDSTTSGSFMIESNLTEPNSLSETIEKPIIETTESVSNVMSETNDNTFPVDSPLKTDTTLDKVSENLLEHTGVESLLTAVEDIGFISTIESFDAQNKDIETKAMTDEVRDESPIQTTEPNNESSVETQKQLVCNKQNESLVGRRKDQLKKSWTASCDIGRPIFTCEEWKAIVQRRSRSLSKSPEKFENKLNIRSHSCGRHQFTCGVCGERGSEQTVPSLSIHRNMFAFPHLKSSIDTTYHNEDEEDIGIHTESYRSALWLYIGRMDEITVWGHKCHKRRYNKMNDISHTKLVSTDSDESTVSERLFRRQYESVTHRMIHRRASIEMYKRAINKNFEIEKEIQINRNNGEFGFRIHGSRPVVVSAIELNTPADICGLDVGDILVSINGTNIMNASHSDVVKIAHSGADTLALAVVSTRYTLIDEIKCENEVMKRDIVINGYLTKFKADAKARKVSKNRWFALKSDNCLYWYKSTKEMEPLGVICLQGYTASSAPERTDQPFAFKLVKYGSANKYFAAKDDETVGQWVNAINERANKLNEADPYVEIAMNNVLKCASSLTPNDCSGYLWTYSQRRKVWRKRYFILKDALLYLYYDLRAKTCLGVFFLHGYRVQSCILMSKRNTFEAIPPEPHDRHLWLMSDSDIDKKRWLAALEYSIDRWIKL